MCVALLALDYFTHGKHSVKFKLKTLNTNPILSVRSKRFHADSGPVNNIADSQQRMFNIFRNERLA